MSEEKYGFVYLWYDSKHHRFYIGSHWGTEDDGYICSSNWMRDAYKRHPETFKRKILKKIYTNRIDTFLEEERYLKMIKPEELRKRYYNISNSVKDHWCQYPIKSKTIKEKIKYKRQFQIFSEEARKKMSLASNGRIKITNNIETKNVKLVQLQEYLDKGFWIGISDKQRKNQSKSHMGLPSGRKGQKASAATIQKMKARTVSEETKQKIREKRALQTITDETKEKLRQSTKNLVWINNGRQNKRINKDEPIQENWSRGRIYNSRQ